MKTRTVNRTMNKTENKTKPANVSKPATPPASNPAPVAKEKKRKGRPVGSSTGPTIVNVKLGDLLAELDKESVIPVKRTWLKLLKTEIKTVDDKPVSTPPVEQTVTK